MRYRISAIAFGLHRMDDPFDDVLDELQIDACLAAWPAGPGSAGGADSFKGFVCGASEGDAGPTGTCHDAARAARRAPLALRDNNGGNQHFSGQVFGSQPINGTLQASGA